MTCTFKISETKSRPVQILKLEALLLVTNDRIYPVTPRLQISMSTTYQQGLPVETAPTE